MYIYIFFTKFILNHEIHSLSSNSKKKKKRKRKTVYDNMTNSIWLTTYETGKKQKRKKKKDTNWVNVTIVGEESEITFRRTVFEFV